MAPNNSNSSSKLEETKDGSREDGPQGQQQREQATPAPKNTGEKIASLWNKDDEKAACGVGFIVNIYGTASHKLLKDAQNISDRMEHRGATSGDNLTGDGAGVLSSIPHRLYADVIK